MQIAIFKINNREYAISVKYLQTVLKAVEIFKVPLSSPEKIGLINFQGDILTVFHFGIIFDNKIEKKDSENVILIIKLETEFESWKLGLFVDRIIDIVQIQDKQISDLPEETKINKEFVSKTIRVENRNIWLLNLENMLIPNELEYEHA